MRPKPAHLESGGASDSSKSNGPARIPARERAWLVPLPEGAWTLPPDCPCCGALAVRETRLSDGQGRNLMLGYCDACAAHVARAATRRLSAALSSLLLGVSAAAGLPIALPWLPAVACVGVSVVVGGLPLLLALLGKRPELGHAAFGASVHFAMPRLLICERQAFAERLAQHLGVSQTAVTTRPRRLEPEAALGIAIPALLAPLLFAFHHPLLRVMNLGDTPLELWADGHRLGRVEPSSGESPTSGLELRVPSGIRTLVTRNPENLEVTRNEVVLQAGRHHLYVPVPRDACFWLESTGYGRQQKLPSFTPLPGEPPFYVVPTHVEGWFVPSAPLEDTARATGGTTTVLRQAGCSKPPDPR